MGMVPNNIKTINPTNPDRTRNNGDQNLNKVSDIAHNPMDTPNKFKLIPRPQSVNHLQTE